MKKLFFFLLILSVTGSLEADSPALHLYYQPSDSILVYLTTFYAQTTDHLNISQPSGEDQTLKNTFYEYVEAKKDVVRKAGGGGGMVSENSYQSTTYQEDVKTYFIKRVERNIAAQSIKPVEKSFKHSALGRLIYPFNMQDVAFFGFPVLFPDEVVKEGDTWEKKFEFMDTDLPVLVMDQEITFRRIALLHTIRIAELEYRFRGGLHTTQMTTDPDIVEKIHALKKDNIESVSFEGSGKVAFDLERGTPLTHEMTMDRKIRKSTIRGEERIIEEMLTVYELTEALTN